MAEVTQNVTKQNTATNNTDSSKGKQSTTLSSLKQSKIGFLPRKNVVPTLLKKDGSILEKIPEDSKINETKNSNDKSPSVNKTNKSEIVKKTSSSKTGKPEENGGIKHTSKHTTPSKKSSNSKKDDKVLTRSPKVSLIKLDKSKAIDNSKSSREKSSKEKSSKEKSSKELDNEKHSKNASKSKSSSPVKKPTTPVKKTSSALKKSTVKKPSSTSKKSPDSISNSSTTKTSSDSISNSSTTKTSSDITSNSSNPNTNSAATSKTPTKSRLVTTVKGNVHCPVEVKSSDEEEDEMSLSELRKKVTPVKLNSSVSIIPNKVAPNKVIPNKVNKNTSLNINLVSNPRPKTPLNPNQGKLNQTLEAIYNRQANGPIQHIKTVSVIPGKPTPPPLNPIPTKNIIIAIDMDPQKWKSLSPQEQTRIIEHKKDLARKHLLQINANKIPMKGIGSPNQNTHILPYNHSPVTPPIMNVHPSKLSSILTSQNTFHNNSKSNVILSPTSTMHIHANHKAYTVNTVPQRHPLTLNSYLRPRTPNFPTQVSQMSPRIGQHLSQNLSMHQMQEFNRQFNFNQFNVKQEESTMIDLKPLPLTKKIPMPPGFPNNCFGDVAMIVEFVNTFRTFLVMQNKSLTADTLMVGVSPGSEKADIVSNILLLFLKVLLSNEDYKVKGLKTELADLPLTEFTVSFLVCQLIKSQLETKRRLRKEKEMAEKAAIVAEKVADLDISVYDSDLSGSDQDLDVALLIDSDDDDDDGNDNDYGKKKKKKETKDVNSLEYKLNRIAHRLDSQDFWMIDATSQITVLTFLMDLILDSDDLSDYYDTVMEDKHKAYRDIDDQRKRRAKVKLEQAVVTLDQFTKKPVDCEKVDGEATDKKNDLDKEEKDTADEPAKETKPDPYAGMTQRQIEAIKSEAGRSENKKKERERQDVEDAKMDYQKCMDKLNNVLTLLKRVMRVEPLGEDRFHRLYWFFSQGIPGLYVSNCCVDDAARHPFGVGKPQEKWSYYNKEEDINQLLCALTVRGLREEKLKSRIRGEHMAIVASIKEIRELELEKENRKKLQKEKLQKAAEMVQKAAEMAQKAAEMAQKVEEKVPKVEEKVQKVEEKVQKVEEKEQKVEEKEQKSEEKENEINAEEKTNNAEEKTNNAEEKTNNAEEKKKGDTIDGEENKKDGEGNKEKVEGDKEEDKVVQKKVESVGVTVDDGDVMEVDKADKKEEGEGIQKEGEGGEKIEKVVGDTEEKKTVEKNDIKEKEKESEPIEIKDDEKDMEDRIYDAHKTSIEALKSDIIESANRIVHGSLGELTELEIWTERVSSVRDVQGLKEFVLQIQSCIIPKFYLSPFKATTEDISKEWCKWVEKCRSLSTMHMLYGLLENSIKWESSAEKMRCKVCRRKKGNETIEQIIVCDGCHLGYHSHCLRPPLSYIPEGEWKCPSCLPKEERNKPKKIIEQNDHQDKAEISSGEEGKHPVESEHEELCHVCESDGMLILCDTCPLSFHLECHKPPLHHAPRGNWSCYECTNPRTKKRGNPGNARKTVAKIPAGKRGKVQRSKYVEYSSDHDMSTDDNTGTASSEADFVPKKKKHKQAESNSTKANQKKNITAKKNPTRKKRAVRNMEISSSDEAEEDEDYDGNEEEDSSSETSQEEVEPEPKGRRAKTLANKKNKSESNKSKSTRTSRTKKNKNLSVDDDEEEEEELESNKSKTTRTSRTKKNKNLTIDDDEEEEEEEEEEEKITAENLKCKIKKFNYKKKTGKRIKHDDEVTSSNDNNKEDETDSSNNGGKGSKEEWEKTQISPTLGNKRPCYAKDGLRKKEEKEEKERNLKKSSPEKSEDEKKVEAMRNMSSADRSFRQAGRNSRRGCNYEMEACRNILVGLRKHKDSWPFLVAVNVKQAPDYLTIIEKPMDFSIVLKYLDDFIYDDVLQFVEDVKLVFENSKKYNLDTSLVGQAGIRLDEEFQSLLKIHLPEVYATFS